MTGAFLGGFLLALLESFWAGYVFAFMVLVVVLIFRPEGILGGSRGADRT